MKHKYGGRVPNVHEVLTRGKLTKAEKEISKWKKTAMLGAVACICVMSGMLVSMYALEQQSLYVKSLHCQIKILKDEAIVSSENIISLRSENDYFMESFLKNKMFKIKVTGYHPDSGGINSDSNPAMTSTMTPHKAGRTCAISTELVEAGWLGREIYIDGFGMVIANDRLSPAIKGKQIDLCKGSYEDAMAVGVHNGVLASVVSRTNIKSMTEE